MARGVKVFIVAPEFGKLLFLLWLSSTNLRLVFLDILCMELLSNFEVFGGVSR